MYDETIEEHRRITRLRAMHARSEYAGRGLIAVGESPHRVLYTANRVVVEFSDDGGVTWVTWPGTENGIETDKSQQAMLSDYDYPIQFRRSYRTYGLGELAETSPALLHTEPTDYRVLELHYEILDVASPHALAEALSNHVVLLPGFMCSISERSLTATPKHAYDDVRLARREFEDQAEHWRFEAETLGGYGFALQFRRSQCEGSPGGALWQIIPTARSESIMSLKPPPIDRLLTPTGDPVATTDVVRQMRERLNRGLLQREPIASLAFWQHQVLEAHFDGKVKACAALNVSSNLWTEIGRLAARHDWREGRKVGGSLADPPLHRRDSLFLSTGCGQLLHRLALAESGAIPLVQLTVDAVRGTAERGFTQEQPSLLPNALLET